MIGAGVGYGLGRDLSSGWNGFWCIALGFGLGSFAGLVVTQGDERGSIVGAFLGSVFLATLWLCLGEVAGAALGGICRAIFGAALGLTLVAAMICD